MSKSNISGSTQRRICSAATNVITTKLATLDGAAGDRLLGQLDAFAAYVVDGLDKFSAALPAKPSVLKLVNASVKLDAIASYDPSGFKTRPGLWVSDEFHSRVGSKAKPVKDLGAVELTSSDLTKNAYDKEIVGDPVMPTNYEFKSESEFVAYLDRMLSKQPNGEAGDLLNNGYWNIFYVAGYVVGVRWDFDDREWGVFAWELGGVYWRAGDRAFGRN